MRNHAEMITESSFEVHTRLFGADFWKRNQSLSSVQSRRQ